MHFFSFFFFFQAEDGIRDYKVTGVQTCALPISRRRCGPWARKATCLRSSPFSMRSEERRVGKSVDLGGRRIIKKKKKKTKKKNTKYNNPKIPKQTNQKYQKKK